MNQPPDWFIDVQYLFLSSVVLKKKHISGRFMVTAAIIAALFALTAFNKIISLRKKEVNLFTVERGTIEISKKSPGLLFADESIEIRGPEMPVNKIRGRYHGSNIPAFQLKILDLVPEGTIVRKGDYVAQLDKTEYENYLQGEREEIEDLRISLEVSVYDSAVYLTNLRDDLKNLTLNVEEAQLNLEKMQFEAPAVIRQAEMKLNRSKQILEQQKRSYRLRQIWKERQVNYNKLNLNSQISKVENIESYISGFTIYALADGMVVYKKNRNGTKRKTGTILNSYDLVVATLPDLSTLVSVTYISEIDIRKISAGQKVNIEVDAIPGKSFTGTVSNIAQIGEELRGSDTKMFEVQARIDGYDPSLRPGMTTSNEIIIKTIDDVYFVPLECVHTGADNVTFVYKKRRTKQVVVPGESDDRNIIISQGLNMGDRVYLTPPDNREKFRYTAPGARRP
jgi:multidrug efflux pump subunit AcrA (membrane-fusion protein)